VLKSIVEFPLKPDSVHVAVRSMCRKRARGADQLKPHLIQVWKYYTQQVFVEDVDKAARLWQNARHRACIRAWEGRFEQRNSGIIVFLFS